MTFIKTLFLSGFLIIFSCQKGVQSNPDTTVHPETIRSEMASNKKIHTIGEILTPKVKRALRDWKEYSRMDELISRYYAISTSEALSNADELSTLAKELKDSVRIKKLAIPPMMARLRVLNSECLRLKDMTAIPAIKPEEVRAKVSDILQAFSAVNAKINSIYAVDDLEGQLALDPDFQTIINTAPDDDTATTVSKTAVTQTRKTESRKQPKTKHFSKLKFDKNRLNKKRLQLKRQALKRQQNK